MSTGVVGIDPPRYQDVVRRLPVVGYGWAAPGLFFTKHQVHLGVPGAEACTEYKSAAFHDRLCFQDLQLHRDPLLQPSKHTSDQEKGFVSNAKGLLNFVNGASERV